MARIAGDDLPRVTQGHVGLTYIYAIGGPAAAPILVQEAVSPSADAKGSEGTGQGTDDAEGRVTREKAPSWRAGNSLLCECKGPMGRVREAGMGVKKGKKREKKVVQSGVAHIQASFNNTIVTVTGMSGNTVVWASAGDQGFKGSRKSTPFAATRAGEVAGKKAMEGGMRQLDVYVKGASIRPASTGRGVSVSRSTAPSFARNRS